LENVAPKLHEILHSVIKANAKAERLFQRFCQANHAYHSQWRLTRGLSQGGILAEGGPPTHTQ